MKTVRLRTVHGTPQDLPDDIRFVELHDASGGLAALVYVEDSGFVKICEAGTPQLQRYARMFGVRLSRVIDLTEE